MWNYINLQHTLPMQGEGAKHSLSHWVKEEDDDDEYDKDDDKDDDDIHDNADGDYTHN